ncbi:hypothetical protein [Aldersonia kunmingensis]|uniref:hypothetical protein n=1 Tax=Aldersonia kunmingensis TaxID=408066 RepID=UPI0012EDE8D4|nr:hypothetical protein [Aldersonia kunmingensis]
MSEADEMLDRQFDATVVGGWYRIDARDVDAAADLDLVSSPSNSTVPPRYRENTH